MNNCVDSFARRIVSVVALAMVMLAGSPQTGQRATCRDRSAGRKIVAAHERLLK